MPGAERLRDCETLTAMLKAQAGEEGKYVAAVCAAPAVVLHSHGILAGKSATCYPAPPFVSVLEDHKDGAEDDVVVDGNVVTSRGPGTSLKFALKLVEVLYGTEKSVELQEQMLVKM
jgi:Putative intracellular protease/amidase